MHIAQRKTPYISVPSAKTITLMLNKLTGVLRLSGVVRVPQVPAAVAEEDDGALATPTSVEACNCDLRLADCMRAQQSFVAALLNIASKLVQYKTKDMRRTQLYAELALINLNLPARVYLPLCNVGSNTKADRGAAPGDANESGYIVMAGEKRTRESLGNSVVGGANV